MNFLVGKIPRSGGVILKNFQTVLDSFLSLDQAVVYSVRFLTLYLLRGTYKGLFFVKYMIKSTK